MYRFEEEHQISFDDFNQSCGMQLDEENMWVVLGNTLEWFRWEKAYADLFESNKGNPAKSFRMALGALLIQKHKGCSDRGLIKEIAESPYLQYFLGLNSFQKKCPFAATALVYFRKRLSAEFLMQINEMYLEKAEATPEHKDEKESKRAKEAKTAKEGKENLGTMILDATCSPQNIRFPQDFSLLNEAREKCEMMIDYFHEAYHPWAKPRTYREVARKEYLALAKAKKRPRKKIRQVIRKQLGYVKRDLGYLEKYMSEGYALPKQYIRIYLTILALYQQQKYMFDNKTNRVEHRIVSISQPYVRPIVRGKAKSPTEFGAKYDVSIDEKGHARLEKTSFEAYNESGVFQDAVEKYKDRNGRYPRRVLVDQIYRTTDNHRFCKEHGIEMSGPKLGRPPKKKKTSKAEYQDNTDRIEVERFFSRDKQCFGAGLIVTKLEETSLTSIALSVLAANIFKPDKEPFFVLYFCESQDNNRAQYFMEFDPLNEAA